MSSGTIMEAASTGSGTVACAGAAFGGGEQVEVAEDAVQEVGLGLRVPVRVASRSSSPPSPSVRRRDPRGRARPRRRARRPAAEPDVEDVLRACRPVICPVPRRGGRCRPRRRRACRRRRPSSSAVSSISTSPVSTASRQASAAYAAPSSAALSPRAGGRLELVVERSRRRADRGRPRPPSGRGARRRANRGAASASRASSASECSRTGGSVGRSADRAWGSAPRTGYG